MKKTLVWGLDGVSVKLFKGYTEAHPGGLFEKIFQDGIVRELTSTMPYFTAPAWTTFATGLQPGIHGNFHWRARYSKKEGNRPLVSSRHLQEATFWSYFQHFGGAVSVTNFPMEYPAPPVNGRYICGTLAPENAEEVSWPKAMMQHIKTKYPEYRFEMNKGLSYMDRPKELWDHIYQVGKHHLDAMMEYGNPFKADLLVHIVTITDRAEHFFWNLYDETHPDYDPALKAAIGNPVFDTMKLAEDYLDKLWQSNRWDNLIVVSDHGMDASKTSFHTDNWLLEKGYLKADSNRRVLMEESMAYSGEEPECSVYVNRKDRDACGLETSEYDAFIQKLRTELLAVRNPANRQLVFADVLFGKDIYHGPAAHLGPDLILLPSEGVHPRNGLTTPDIHGTATRLYANHRPDGIFMGYGKDIRPSARSEQNAALHIQDMFPLLCLLCDLPIPADLSGSIPENVGQYIDLVAKEDPEWDWPSQVKGLPTFQDFNPQIIERLSELGYL